MSPAECQGTRRSLWPAVLRGMMARGAEPAAQAPMRASPDAPATRSARGPAQAERRRTPPLARTTRSTYGARQEPELAPAAGATGMWTSERLRNQGVNGPFQYTAYASPVAR